MRFVLAEMMHETNTFSPLPTPLEAFAMGTGRAGPALGTEAALMRFEGTNTSLGGLIQVAREAGAGITIPIAGGAPPSGRVDDPAFETFAEAITGAVAEGCDAVLLALHGAMATRNLMTALRETGEIRGGGRPFTRQDRARFLGALDVAIQAIRRSGS